MIKLLTNKKAFTPLEKATDEVGGGIPYKADGGLMPPSAYSVSPVRNKLSNGVTGFTLTEIVVAVVVLAAAISGLWASFIASKRYTTQAKVRVMAIHNARYVLEGLRQDVRADTWDTGRLRDGIVDEDITSWLPSGDDTFVTKYNGTAKYSVIDSGGYRKVNLTMTWDQPELE